MRFDGWDRVLYASIIWSDLSNFSSDSSLLTFVVSITNLSSVRTLTNASFIRVHKLANIFLFYVLLETLRGLYKQRSFKISQLGTIHRFLYNWRLNLFWQNQNFLFCLVYYNGHLELHFDHFFFCRSFTTKVTVF